MRAAKKELQISSIEGGSIVGIETSLRAFFTFTTAAIDNARFIGTSQIRINSETLGEFRRANHFAGQWKPSPLNECLVLGRRVKRLVTAANGSYLRHRNVGRANKL